MLELVELQLVEFISVWFVTGGVTSGEQFMLKFRFSSFIVWLVKDLEEVDNENETVKF